MLESCDIQVLGYLSPGIFKSWDTGVLDTEVLGYWSPGHWITRYIAQWESMKMGRKRRGVSGNGDG